jgi:hypothetical protein
MKRRLSTVLAGPALLLAFASSAMGATTLGFSEVKHEPAAVNRGDEYVGYMVKVKNIGAGPTTGTMTLAIALPVGMKLAEGKGSGWICHLGAQTCANATVVAAGRNSRSWS